MKIVEEKIKEDFLELFRQRKKERMLQYKFKDEFLESLEKCFEDDSKKSPDDVLHKSNSFCKPAHNKERCDGCDLQNDVEDLCDVVDI